MGHLSLEVGREVIGQQIVVTAMDDGIHNGLEVVLPSKLAIADKVGHPHIPRIKLHQMTDFRHARQWNRAWHTGDVRMQRCLHAGCMAGQEAIAAENNTQAQFAVLFRLSL